MRSPQQDFDWGKADSRGFGVGYSKEDKDKLTAAYDVTITAVPEKEVVTGTVVGMTDKDIILNIGYKSDGLVPRSEFKDLEEDLQIGSRVEVYVEDQEDAHGQLVVSRKKARVAQAWKQIQLGLDNDIIIEGEVKRRTKGGLIVDIYGIEAFLPGSQIDVKPIRDFDVYVGKKMEVKVVKINAVNENVVVSHKVLIEKDLEEQKAQILNNLEKGQVLEGVIKNMTSFGVFIDLGGVDGLLHITDISWGRISDPKEVLQLDEKVQVVVLDFDEDKKRISLGMKQLQAHPWEQLSEDIQVGSRLKGRVVNVPDYGAFVEVAPGVEGLVHVSEMSWSQHLRNPQDFMKPGDEVETMVLAIDRQERKLSLGIKQLTEDPWTRGDIAKKYAVGSRHTGTVRNLTTYGLFVELEEGIDGLVHISDLSWTRKLKHPSEMVKVEDKLEVMVLELDLENRRISLGHKQVEENPWDTFENVFPAGSTHKGTITGKVEKGFTVELPYGIEGFATGKQVLLADGATPNVGDQLDFKVMEFNKEDRRILVSHTATFQAEAPEKKAAAPKKAATAKKDGTPEHTGPVTISNEAASTSLGDNEALSALREKLSGK